MKKVTYCWASFIVFFPNKIEMTEMGMTCSTYREIQKCIWGFSGKPEGKRPFGRLRCRWVDNIKMDLREVGCIVYSLVSYSQSWLFYSSFLRPCCWIQSRFYCCYLKVVFRWNCAPHRLTIKADSLLLVSAFKWKFFTMACTTQKAPESTGYCASQVKKWRQHTALPTSYLHCRYSSKHHSALITRTSRLFKLLRLIFKSLSAFKWRLKKKIEDILLHYFQIPFPTINLSFTQQYGKSNNQTSRK